jgi:hypothetical protein
MPSSWRPVPFVTGDNGLIVFHYATDLPAGGRRDGGSGAGDDAGSRGNYPRGRRARRGRAGPRA